MFQRICGLDIIINKGKIESNGIFNGNGGTIKIKCKQFINEGIISAKHNGNIYIILSERVFLVYTIS